MYIRREGKVGLLVIHEGEEVRGERVGGGGHSVAVGEAGLGGGGEGGREGEGL